MLVTEDPSGRKVIMLQPGEVLYVCGPHGTHPDICGMQDAASIIHPAVRVTARAQVHDPIGETP